MNGRRKYKKDAKYGEKLVTIENKLVDLLPSNIDGRRDYTIKEILELLPRYLIGNIYINDNWGREALINLVHLVNRDIDVSSIDIENIWVSECETYEVTGEEAK